MACDWHFGFYQMHPCKSFKTGNATAENMGNKTETYLPAAEDILESSLSRQVNKTSLSQYALRLGQAVLTLDTVSMSLGSLIIIYFLFCY